MDPIDGTTNYIHQFPAFCVSIGLAHEGRLVLGVIYDPWRGELFHGAAGGGAFCNRRRIHVAGRRSACCRRRVGGGHRSSVARIPKWTYRGLPGYRAILFGRATVVHPAGPLRLALAPPEVLLSGKLNP